MSILKSLILILRAQKITAFASEERGYIATSSSEKQANGKLRGEVVVKVLPEISIAFCKDPRLGELKNQTLGTEDVTRHISTPTRDLRMPASSSSAWSRC